jgi:hypothetical protein
MLDAYIIFLDKDNNKHTIPVSIFNTNLGNRWSKLIIKNQKLLSGKKIHSSFSNYTLKDINRILEELNAISKNINREYDRLLPIFSNSTEIDTKILNDLHEEFEFYGTRLDELSLSLDFSQDLHNNFLLLNELIHVLEDLITSATLNPRLPPMSVVLDFYPQTEFESLLERDKLHLTSEFKWGNLYLGYNTLGKDWLKVCLDNDLEVIERDMVKPQIRFAAETWLNFGPDNFENNNVNTFINWYAGLPANIQQKVPIDNLNALSFGRYSLGKVEINDDYFLKYHPEKADWLSYNHPIKKKWNEEVFSTFRKIKKIGFYN